MPHNYHCVRLSQVGIMMPGRNTHASKVTAAHWTKQCELSVAVSQVGIMMPGRNTHASKVTAAHWTKQCELSVAVLRSLP